MTDYSKMMPSAVCPQAYETPRVPQNYARLSDRDYPRVVISTSYLNHELEQIGFVRRVAKCGAE